MKGIVIGTFPIGDYGYSVQVQCTSRKKHTVKVLLNKAQYLACVKEVTVVPDQLINVGWLFRQQW
jgi:hypothetical protein